MEKTEWRKTKNTQPHSMLCVRASEMCISHCWCWHWCWCWARANEIKKHTHQAKHQLSNMLVFDADAVCLSVRFSLFFFISFNRKNELNSQQSGERDEIRRCKWCWHAWFCTRLNMNSVCVCWVCWVCVHGMVTVSVTSISYAKCNERFSEREW